jgi:hypothetical protein
VRRTPPRSAGLWRSTGASKATCCCWGTSRTSLPRPSAVICNRSSVPAGRARYPGSCARRPVWLDCENNRVVPQRRWRFCSVCTANSPKGSIRRTSSAHVRFSRICNPGPARRLWASLLRNILQKVIGLVDFPVIQHTFRNRLIRTSLNFRGCIQAREGHGAQHRGALATDPTPLRSERLIGALTLRVRTR